MLTMSQINPSAILSNPQQESIIKGSTFNDGQEARDKAEAKMALKQMDMQREDTKYATEMAQEERFRGEDRHDKAFANMAKDPMNAKMYAEQGGIQWTPEMEQLASDSKKFALTAKAAQMVKQMGITNAQTAQTFASTFVNNNGDLDQTIASISSMEQYRPDMRRTQAASGGGGAYKKKIGAVPKGYYQSWDDSGNPIIQPMGGYTPPPPATTSPLPNEPRTIDALIADPTTDPLVLQQAMDAEDAKNRTAQPVTNPLPVPVPMSPPATTGGGGMVDTYNQNGLKGVGDALKQQYAPDFFRKEAPQMQGVPLPPSEPPTTKFLGMDAASGYGKFQRADGTMFLSDGED